MVQCRRSAKWISHRQLFPPFKLPVEILHVMLFGDAFNARSQFAWQRELASGTSVTCDSTTRLGHFTFRDAAGAAGRGAVFW